MSYHEWGEWPEELKLVRYPDPLLNLVSEDCLETDLPYILSVKDQMIKIMDEYKGVGLAAVQAGILKRFAIIKDKAGQNNLIINPEIEQGEALQDMREGCLSLPFFYETIVRFEQIIVKFKDETWTEHRAIMNGQEAQCLQHELNHMSGLLILETVSPMKQQMWIKKAKKKGFLK